MPILKQKPRNIDNFTNEKITKTQGTTIQSLLQLEGQCVLNESYFKNQFQNKIQPQMRTELALWMLEVCEEEKCTNEVYSVAMNLFDRLLSEIKVESRHLQLFGCVCLYIASSSSTGNGLNEYKLVDYTDNTITVEELLEWTKFVQFRLNSNQNSSVCANDYLSHILSHSTKSNIVNIEQFYKLTALCSTNLKYSLQTPSMIAIACLLNSIEVKTQYENELCKIFKNYKSCVDKQAVMKLRNEIKIDFQV